MQQARPPDSGGAVEHHESTAAVLGADQGAHDLLPLTVAVDQPGPVPARTSSYGCLNTAPVPQHDPDPVQLKNN